LNAAVAGCKEASAEVDANRKAREADTHYKVGREG
jgi:hypothetical protein